MWLENDAMRADMKRICASDFIPWEELRGKTLFVTGATGLIGFTLISALIYANIQRDLGMKLLALVRDEARARERFGGQLEAKAGLRLIIGDVTQPIRLEGPIDYIVHGASQTASKAFIERPVETIKTALRGTENMLELAKEKHVKGMVYLSSMEVYGNPEKGNKVREEDIGRLPPQDVRNSYPISKVQCESLCRAYESEYGVPVESLRLTQTFGPGVKDDDHRVFAEFGRCVLEKRDIVLRTKGETERSYLYTADAATAILTVLLKGKPGEVYNAADERTYCSIAEMAYRVAAQGGIGVRFELRDEREMGYPSPLYMDLDTQKLRSLGWNPRGGGYAILKCWNGCM